MPIYFNFSEINFAHFFEISIISLLILAGIFEYQEDPIEPIALEDLPHMMGKVDIRGLDDPDAVLGYLKCPDRINYCFKTDPEIWKKCSVEEINNKYILPCKMNTIIERKIKEICEINNPFSGEEYKEMIERNLDILKIRNGNSFVIN